MRGEETQLLGALRLTGVDDGCYVLPGTHSKWVNLRDGCVSWMRTYLSGELFALLRERGTLASIMRTDNAASELDTSHGQAFEQGVSVASEAAVSHALFAARARVVTGALPPAHAAAFVSGALFGAEWHDMAARLRDAGAVRLLGDERLCMRHALCARVLGVQTEVVDSSQAQNAAWVKLRDEGPR
jgi:2-dehydro-3-deoxygalactonokinase